MKTVFNKSAAIDALRKGLSVQHLDWLEEHGGKFRYIRQNNQGLIVDELGDVVDMDVFAEEIDCWQICQHGFEVEAYANLIMENRNMGDFILSLGYSLDELGNIALCGEKPVSKARGYLKRRYKDFGPAAIEVLFSDLADYTPTCFVSNDGHIFKLSTLKSTLEELIEEEGEEDAIAGIAKVISDMEASNCDLLQVIG